jgi:superfamily I DNA/RNA helicase
MSLWWANKEQLDKYQLKLIEELPLAESCLILGPPGSGKTNVLLRRAQFVRSQEMPNVLVLTFTRSLTEFIKTGCLDAQNREIFPRSCVMTIESWMRSLYAQHSEDLPEEREKLIERKKVLARGASTFQERGYLPRYDALFVDEAQDLVEEEISLFSQWSPVLCFVGDSRQKIFKEAEGLESVRKIIPSLHEYMLPFHYRLCPKICRMADRILTSQAGSALEASSHYDGPKPGEIHVIGPLDRHEQLEQVAVKLRDQVRVYADRILEGDRLGVVVARTSDREVVLDYLEQDDFLRGKSKIVRARGENERDYDPTLDPETPICIITVAGCKGLEFRALHWPFCEELSNYHDNETYYTVVTRAKTSLDLYYTKELPQALARGYSDSGGQLW